MLSMVYGTGTTPVTGRAVRMVLGSSKSTNDVEKARFARQGRQSAACAAWRNDRPAGRYYA
jgi:hypothetical protein